MRISFRRDDSRPVLVGVLAAGLGLWFNGAAGFAEEPEAQEAAPAASPAPAAAEAGEAKAAPEKAAAEAPAPGHSVHGEAFDEGPRRAARRIEGTGDVSFPVTTKSAEAQAFFNQGVGQLHGFWYFEAERSFRQVHKLDPECGMAYWGLAMANVNNASRARKLIEAGKPLRDKLSDQEKPWFDGLAEYYRDEKRPEKDRRRDFIRSLEGIVQDQPQNVEAKAFLAWWIWASHSQLPISSHQAVDSLLDQVFAAAPMHPAHHYRIHLWDEEKAARALTSAARGGQAAPGIAHLWHMPGHTYSKTHRYHDAVWQQEAAVRVDHAYMLRDAVSPYEIHNYAHNSEWLVRNFSLLGRADDGAQIARSLIEEPRHPKHNTLSKGGSAATYGRLRLLSILAKHERWEAILAAADAGLLDPPPASETDLAGPPTADHERERLRQIGAAAYMTKRFERGDAVLAEVEGRIVRLSEEIQKLTPPSAAKPAGQGKPEGQGKPKGQGKPSAESPKETTAARPECRPAADGKTDAPAAEKTAAAPNAAPEPTLAPSAPKEAAPVAVPPANAEDKAQEKPSADPAAKEKPGVVKSTDAKEDPAKAAAAKEEAKKKEDAKRKSQLESRRKALERVAAELRGWKAAGKGDWKASLAEFEKGELSKSTKARFLLELGQNDAAVEAAKKARDDGSRQVQPQAVLVEVLYRAGKKEDAKKEFTALRTLAGAADRDLPCLQRLSVAAKEFGFPEDWRIAPVPATDVGVRPELEALGPRMWAPPKAPDWETVDADGRPLSAATLAGKPTVLLFYLGGGCPHCLQQLGRFAQTAEKFREAGIELAAVSTEAPESLAASREALPEGDDFPIRLAADPGFALFRKFDAYDEFEQIPLHATILLDGRGRILWKEAGAEPFLDAPFLLTEARRLLRLQAVGEKP